MQLQIYAKTHQCGFIAVRFAIRSRCVTLEQKVDVI